MKVFISWSGQTSRAVGEALHWWLPHVIQCVQPFLSAKDIDKGATWSTELSSELEDTRFGVVCLAADNLGSPWLHYEAGAISKSVDARVCPVLFKVDKSQVASPLAQLQLTDLDLEDVILLMQSMNKAAESPLTDVALKESVEIWWPQLQEQLDKVAEPNGPTQPSSAGEPTKPEPTDRELLTEILGRVRAPASPGVTVRKDPAGRTDEDLPPLEIRLEHFSRRARLMLPEEIESIRLTDPDDSTVHVRIKAPVDPEIRERLRHIAARQYDLNVRFVRRKAAVVQPE